MCKPDKENITMMIEHKTRYSLSATTYDFNKTVRTLLKNPEFDLMG